MTKRESYSARANGRVNLIGEHTDYNGGFVLPTAIPQGTWVELSTRSDQLVRVESRTMKAGVFEFRLGEERRTGTWGDYVQGTVLALAQEVGPLGGFDAVIDSTVPAGSGLSSSAALEVSLVRALALANSLALGGLQIARICQRAENDFVGARVGIMDPLAAALATTESALFVDTRALSYESVPLPLDRLDLVVIHSGVSHRNAAGGYNRRREECEAAAAAMGVREPRDLGHADLGRVERLPDPLSRRARHVITENDRVIAAVRALRAKDMEALGLLLRASHASLRDDYEVSVPEIDELVGIAGRDTDVWGARITGGGFGGSVVIAAKAGAGKDVGARVAKQYADRTGRTPHVLVP